MKKFLMSAFLFVSVQAWCSEDALPELPYFSKEEVIFRAIFHKLSDESIMKSRRRVCAWIKKNKELAQAGSAANLCQVQENVLAVYHHRDSFDHSHSVYSRKSVESVNCCGCFFKWRKVN